MGGIKTYILKTRSGEFYCGKTNDIERRLQQHKNEKYPQWFCNNDRKDFILVCCLSEDYEKNIKKFGVKNFYNMIKQNINFPGVS